MQDKITVPAIRARKQGLKITMVTAYDTPMAHIVDRAEYQSGRTNTRRERT